MSEEGSGVAAPGGHARGRAARAGAQWIFSSSVMPLARAKVARNSRASTRSFCSGRQVSRAAVGERRARRAGCGLAHAVRVKCAKDGQRALLELLLGEAQRGGEVGADAYRAKLVRGEAEALRHVVERVPQGLNVPLGHWRARGKRRGRATRPGVAASTAPTPRLGCCATGPGAHGSGRSPPAICRTPSRFAGPLRSPGRGKWRFGDSEIRCGGRRNPKTPATALMQGRGRAPRLHEARPSTPRS